MYHKEKVNSKNNNTEPMLINGGTFVDNRGQLFFVNDFHFKGIKRFYIIKDTDVKIIRAWQGHRYEEKYFYVLKGAFRIALIENENWDVPERTATCKVYHLKASVPQILCVPGRYINGFRSEENDSMLIVFSNMDLHNSEKDDHRWGVKYFDCWENAFNG